MSSDLDPTSCVSWRSTWHRRRSRCVAGIAASVLPVGAAFAPSASSDGLWNPASVVFGPRWGDRVYITNYAVLPPVPPANLGPAVSGYDAGVRGWPFR